MVAKYAGAKYACDPDQSRGRLYREEESVFRSAFQRDRDRIIHASAFRRLKHKTQVFIEHEGDYFRTRLTHSIEVAQVARTLAGTLGLNPELTEAVALAHDLGHPPFGHTGEDALAELMAPFGGFDHNAQAIRIVTSLERHYAEWDGLNLTWETLEGIAKHNGPVTQGSPQNDHSAAQDVPWALADYNARHDLELHTHASAEAQVAATSVTLDCEALAKHPSALSSRLIKLAIETVGGQTSATAIESVTALVLDWHGQKPLTLSGTRVERTGRSLVFRTTKTLKTGAC